MMKLLRILPLIGLLYMMNACSTDFDINASYQEITVVYGLLDPGADTTYLKINKAFLGDENAMIMARIPDSSQFIQRLHVRMWAEDDPETLYHFDTITLDNKDSGYFYYPNHILYYHPFKPEENKKYLLRILYKEHEITSETSTFKFTENDINPPGFALKIGFINDNEPRLTAWTRNELAPRYELTIRFHFKEIWEGSADTVYRFIDWHKDYVKAVTGDKVESYYTGSSFYNALATFVPYKDAAQEAKVTSRFTGNVDFIVDAGGIELNTYMEVNEPSSSIIQDRPEYSNIENGIGLFSSRARAVKSKGVNDLTLSVIKEDYYWLKFIF
jgi:hypothetical protein